MTARVRCLGALARPVLAGLVAAIALLSRPTTGLADYTTTIDTTQMRFARTLSVIAVLGWLAAACLAGLRGAVDQSGQPPLVLLGLVAVPILGFVTAYRFSAAFRAFAHQIERVAGVEADGLILGRVVDQVFAGELEAALFIAAVEAHASLGQCDAQVVQRGVLELLHNPHLRVRHGAVAGIVADVLK